jgi:PAS domain S-box-containing protein
MRVLRPVFWGYLAALAGPPAVAWLRFGLQDHFASRAQFVLFTVPVALAACLGGLYPGLIASIFGLLLAIYLFVPEINSFHIVDRADLIQAYSFALIWTFITLVCHWMREYARAEMASERRLSAHVDRISDAFYAVDRDWKITTANPAFAALVGRPGEDLRGTRLWSLFPDPRNAPIQAMLEQAMRDQKPLATDAHYEGEELWFHLRAFPDTEGMVVYVQDVTERKRLEANLDRLLESERQLRLQAEAANRAKDEFLMTLSHELRTPLTAIVGWTEILEHEPLGDRAKVGLREISRSAWEQTALVTDLLETSRIAAGNLQLERSWCDLASIAESAISGYAPQAAEKGVRLRLEIGDEAPHIHCDEKRIRQVLGNLITNALKFTSAGGQIDIHVRQEDTDAVLMVRDSGEGIAPEFLERIFDRFQQADSSPARRHMGLGLGLSIVRDLVQLHGGQVSVESAGLGKGSTFWVRIPLLHGDEPERTPPGKPPPPRLAGLRILLVEDDRASRDVIALMLEDAGATVLPAANAEEGLGLFAQGDLDVIVSDIGLPKMDGLAFIRRIRSQGSQVPAIALSAFASNTDRDRCREAGYQDFLSKPVRAAELQEALAHLTQKK